MFRFVNRLDAPTSGLICIAYTPKAAGMVSSRGYIISNFLFEKILINNFTSQASKAFQNRATKKLYLAVVWGHVQDSSSLDPTSLPTSKYLPELNVNPSLCTEMCKKTGDMEYTVDIAIGDYQITWPSGCIQKIMVPYFVTDCWVSKLLLACYSICFSAVSVPILAKIYNVSKFHKVLAKLVATEKCYFNRSEHV